jgi:hypothetical protein
LSIGIGLPITPVLITNTSIGEQPIFAATIAVISSASRIPASPVQALALPLLMITARVLLDGVLMRQSVTGAATT